MLSCRDFEVIEVFGPASSSPKWKLSSARCGIGLRVDGCFRERPSYSEDSSASCRQPEDLGLDFGSRSTVRLSPVGEQVQVFAVGNGAVLLKGHSGWVLQPPDDSVVEDRGGVWVIRAVDG